MCLECSAYHLKRRICKPHKTENIEIERTENKSSETNLLEGDLCMLCQMHKEELSHLGESYDRAICDECIYQNHRLNKIKPITFSAQTGETFCSLRLV